MDFATSIKKDMNEELSKLENNKTPRIEIKN
jgi:hypothetical protein